MFTDIRRQDRRMELKDAAELLEKGTYGVLSLNGENDYAYGVPLSYVYLDEKIYFHCALAGEKLNRVRRNNKVSFCVVGKAATLPDKFAVEYASAMVFGKAREVDGEEKIKALRAFIVKYSGDYLETGKDYIVDNHPRTVVLKLDIEHITGKARR